MEKQNKIYATVQGDKLLGCSAKPYRFCEEFIRKDALLEWAKEGKEHYKKLMEDFPDETSFAASFGAYSAFNEKLNSM